MSSAMKPVKITFIQEECDIKALTRLKRLPLHSPFLKIHCSKKHWSKERRPEPLNRLINEEK